MRLRWRLRTMLIVMPLIGTAMAFVIPALDAASHGPYSLWFNRRCQRLADEANLVGRPEEDVIKVMGPPTYTYFNRTYNPSETRET